VPVEAVHLAGEHTEVVAEGGVAAELGLGRLSKVEQILYSSTSAPIRAIWASWARTSSSKASPLDGVRPLGDDDLGTGCVEAGLQRQDRRRARRLDSAPDPRRADQDPVDPAGPPHLETRAGWRHPFAERREEAAPMPHQAAHA